MLECKSVRIDAPGKRICFWGAPSHFAASGDWQIDLARTGANTGNLFIGNGLFHNVDCAEKSYGLDFARTDPARLHEFYDQIFIPCSNFLNGSSDFAAAYEFLVQTKLPLFSFGLGSQHKPGQDLVLKPGTENFIRLLSERGGMVGVRGDFTATLMNGMGLKNVAVIGCPSLLGMSPKAASRLQHQAPSLDKIGIHFSNNVRSHALHPAEMRATENTLFHRMISENAFYVIQNEVEEFRLAAAFDEGDEAAIARSGGALAKTFDIALPNQAFIDFLRHRIRYFFNTVDWIAAMTTMTASIGSRFHGTVSALLAGTPSLLLAHDMRTLEMADLFQIPRLVVDRNYSQDELIERLLSVDMVPFVARLSALHVEWKHFVRANGLEMVQACSPQPALATP